MTMIDERPTAAQPTPQPERRQGAASRAPGPAIDPALLTIQQM